MDETPRTRKRSWAEHPLSIPTNLSWAISVLYLITVALIHDVSFLGWVIPILWTAANVVATLFIRRRLEIPLEPVRAEVEGEPVEGTSLFRDAMRRLRRNQLATLSMGVLIGIALLCFTQQGAYYALKPAPGEQGSADAESFFSLRVDHTHVNKDETYAPPSARHWFGTDSLGRDVFSRTLYGGGISFVVGLVATIVSLLIGVTWGATAGYFGGRADHYMMRFVDVLYGLPFLFLVILIMTLVNGLSQTAKEHSETVGKVAQLEEEGNSAAAQQVLDDAGIDAASYTEIRWAVWITDNVHPIFIMFFALGIVQWLTMARITRGQVLSLKEREFVVAARVVGAGNLRIIFRHIVPNLLGPIIVYTTLTIPTVILSEAFLSFIGLGISEPHCSWGTLARDGINAINVIKPYWWLIAYPAAAISIALFSLNFIGDGLRDALDPKQSR